MMVNADLRTVATKGLLRAVGDEIRERRLAKGLSQEVLAARGGLHRNFIGLIERGQRNSTLLTLEAVADVLKTRLSDVMLGAERRAKSG